MRMISLPSTQFRSTQFLLIFAFSVAFFGLWMVFIGVIGDVILNGWQFDPAKWIATLMMAALLLGLLYGLYRFGRYMKRSFVDQVLDAGDALIVCKSGAEARIELANILKVDFLIGRVINRFGFETKQEIISSTITLILNTPCCFGKEMRFFRSGDITKDDLNDLNQRIAQARPG